MTSYGIITSNLSKIVNRDYTIPSSSFQGWHHHFYINIGSATFNYREDTSPSILQNATNDVQRLALYKDFVATVAVINTFYRVRDEGINAEHTFQQILTSDGQRTFAILNYELVPCTAVFLTNEVSYADESSSSKCVLIGENDTHHVLNTSNVGINGRHVFPLFQPDCYNVTYGTYKSFVHTDKSFFHCFMIVIM